MGRIGIFRSPDGEDTWEKVADGFFLSPIQSFAIIEDTIYAGRGGLNPWPVGVYRSDDNGDTWTPSGLKNQHVFSLTVMDTTLYAGTQQGEVFRSENGEESWEKTSLAAPHRIISLEASREALYAGTWSGGVFRSENRGDTWTPLNTGLATLNIATLVSADATLYAATSDGIYRLNNRENTWAQMGLSNESVRVLAIFQNTLYASTESGKIYRATLPQQATLQITAVDPNPVPGLNISQWITIRGKNFDPGFRAELRVGTEIHPIPDPEKKNWTLDPTWFISDEEVRVCTNVTTETANWTVQVFNPNDKASDKFPLRVDGEWTLTQGELQFLNAAFEEAAAEYEIPSNLLRAIAYVESRWVKSACSFDHGRGIMQLTKSKVLAIAHDALETRWKLDPDLLEEPTRESARANILGAGAILSHWWITEKEFVDSNAPREALESWWWLVAQYNGGGGDKKLSTGNYPFRVYNALRNGVPGKVPMVDISFPPNTSVNATGVNETPYLLPGDVNLFPLVPGENVRKVDPSFKALELVLHANDGSIIHNPDQPSIDTATADIDGNEVVDIVDIVIVGASFGKSGKGLAADVNNDGVIDIFDLVLVAAHFGETVGVAAPAASHQVSAEHSTMLEHWLEETRRINDGSEMFRQGITMLEYLLDTIIPEETVLIPNYPNPFNPETWIPYKLAKHTSVTVVIYSTTGHTVRRIDIGLQSPGIHESRDRAIHWDGRNDQGEHVASGVYFYTFTASDFTATRKMLVLK